MLKEKGIKLDLDQPNDQYWNAVFAAIAEHRIEILKLLIEAGASIKVKNISGDTPAFLATRHGMLKLSKEKSHQKSLLTFLYKEERNLGIILEQIKHQQESSIKTLPTDINNLILNFLFLEARIKKQVIPAMKSAEEIYRKKHRR
jgi:ankyrin repeat protein